MVTYPLFPEIITFDRDNPALKPLRQVRMYFPTAVDTTLAAEKDSVTITPLLYTTVKSSVQSPPYDINPLTRQNMRQWDHGHEALGAVLQGKFESYFKDRDVPKNDNDEPVSEDDVIPRSPETRIVVLGDANFIQDQFLVQGLDNLTMVLNLIDWLVQDERLISIRSRDVSSRPIGEVSDATRRTVKYANMILPPIIVIIFGLMRWQMRRSRRAQLEITSGGSKIGGADK